MRRWISRFEQPELTTALAIAKIQEAQAASTTGKGMKQ
jgi:hypothetical protein